MKPVVSIITPTWNRGLYLEKVWESLKSQSYQNFEWIIGNDGSTDDTCARVKNFSEKSSFPITIISASLRIGKSRMDNEAVRIAKGEFILFCDSDDYLLSNALEMLTNTWNSISENEKDEFSGVTALCDSNNGILDKMYPGSKYTDIKLNDLLSKMQFDMVLFGRADELKKNPFKEVDYLISETSVWNIIGVKKTRYIPVPLVYKNYGSDNCISYSGLMEYNRGKAYAMSASKSVNSSSNMTIKKTLWRLITYIRYCIHGEINIVDAWRMWGVKGIEMMHVFIVFPLAIILSIKDQIQGKVRKTHRNYLKAEKEVQIKVEMYNT